MTNPKLADELTALAEKATAGNLAYCADRTLTVEGLPIARFYASEDRNAEANAALIVALRNNLPEIHAALTARSDGWRDIESAPRDGTRIIAGKWAWIHKEISTVFDEEAPKIWHLCFATTAFFLADKGYWTDGLERLVNPSHWLPLPTPPETTP